MINELSTGICVHVRKDNLFSLGNKNYMMGNKTYDFFVCVYILLVPSKPAGLFQSNFTQVSRCFIPTSFIKIDSTEGRQSSLFP